MKNIITTNQASDLHSDFFTKSHQLVFSQLSLSPIEHDIFALFLTRLAKEHWEAYMGEQRVDYVPRYEFSTDVLSEWFGVQKTYLHSTLFKPADRLSSRKIGVHSDSKKSFDFIPLFKRIKYDQGTLTVVPNDELLNEYLCLGQGHSQIPHRQFRTIPLEHGKRLFTLFCRFRTYGKLHPQSIEDLHGFFGLLDQQGKLVKKTYAKTAVFISRIIKPAITSINDNVEDLEFHVDEKTGNYGFRYHKKGRSIVAIEFLFSWKTKPVDTSDFVNQLTFEDAIKTHRDIELKDSLPTLAEIENLKQHIPRLLLEGFNFDSDFATKLNECILYADNDMTTVD
ncbi:replication initiation protein [Enterovibrio norvegicus]|uniref:Replication initiation protein n=1 Tax=Enterovibrio norvegicus TaxID=188144 RepID=A0ABV4L6T3_9GAMM